MYNFILSRNAPHIQGPSWNCYSRWAPDEAKNIVTIMMKMVIVSFLNITMREGLREHD